MKIAHAVIGAAFGDEGKGLMVDAFSTASSTVCRFNGGAQAGHTVEMPDGRRHVFHHFGSGGFRRAGTYLSRFFISNPMLYVLEQRALQSLRVEGCRLKVDKDGLVTTPYDMMINQLSETSRGDAKHGSCGYGINETIVRSEQPEFRLTVWDLHDPEKLADRLRQIRLHWTPFRIGKLGLPMDSIYQPHFLDEGIQNHFVDDATTFCRSIDVLTSAMSPDDQHIVFEGAQGLLLDENHEFFPHVTRSSTGLKNVVTLAKDARVDALNTVYVTRAYTTRHGAGPFPHEQPQLSYTDRTNHPNGWQGSLRFGHLDLDLIGEAIRADMRHADLPMDASLAITCINQIGNEFWYWHHGTLRMAPVDRIKSVVEDALNLRVDYLVNGPTADSVNCPQAGKRWID